MCLTKQPTERRLGTAPRELSEAGHVVDEVLDGLQLVQSNPQRVKMPETQYAAEMDM